VAARIKVSRLLIVVATPPRHAARLPCEPGGVTLELFARG